MTSPHGNGDTPEDEEDLEEFLDAPLSRRPLPARMLYWADGKARRFRDLLAWTPERLARERNIGSTTIGETRRLIERETGRTWEELSEELHGNTGLDDLEEPPQSVPAWDQLARFLDEESAALPLDDIELPARMRTFVARVGLVTLGDLLRVPRAVLAEVPKLGQATIARTAVVLHALLRERGARAPAPELDDHGDLVGLLRHKIEALDEAAALVVRRRAGIDGEPEKFVDIGLSLGVSRQRVGQIEERAVASMARDGAWIGALEARLRRRMKGGAVALDALAQDPFFAPVATRRHVLEYVLDRFLEGRLNVVVVDERPLVTEATQRAVDEAWEDLLAEARALAFPVEGREVDALFAGHRDRLGGGIAAALRAQLETRLRRIPGGTPARYAGLVPRKARGGGP